MILEVVDPVTQLFYRVVGKRDGSCRVLLHSLGLDHTVWSQVEPLLAVHRRLLLIDLPGHGSSSVGDGMTVEHAADRVIALIRSLGLRDCYLAGLSIGGLVAQRVAESAPELVRGRILCGSNYLDTPTRLRGVMTEFADRIERDGLASMASFLGQRWLGPEDGTDSPAVAALRRLLAAANPKVVVDGLRAVAGSHVRDPERLKGTRCLVLVAEHDPPTSHEAARELARILGSSEVVRVPDSYHASPAINPAFVASAIAAFTEAG